ncbi:hypothetical protein DEH12_16690 [Vibrio cholerae]|nr:hypothetical protein [Vibrio cholerae]
MSIMLYPNKTEPTAYRIQDKVLGVQRYFAFSRYGSDQKAKQTAKAALEELKRRRRMRELRLELDANQLFYPDGRVIGLRTAKKTIKGREVPILIAQITVDGKQIKTDRRLLNRSFFDVYRDIQDWILTKKGIERTPEITQRFKQAAWLYRI